MPDRPPLLALRVAAWRARWWVRAGALALVALALARAAAPAPPPGEAVVVTAHAVAAGQVLSAGDLRVVRLAPSSVPDGAARTEDALVGRAAATALPAGLPLVGALLAGERFAEDPPDGAVVVAVTLPGADLLLPGDRVDVVTTPDEDKLLGAEGQPAGPDVLAHGALVLEVGEPEPSGLLSGTATAPQVLLAVTPDEGHRIAATAGAGTLGAVLVG